MTQSEELATNFGALGSRGLRSLRVLGVKCLRSLRILQAHAPSPKAWVLKGLCLWVVG